MGVENQNHRSSKGTTYVTVDLHCHSDASDGYYTPAAVAEMLADAGVGVASLTDHQTLVGLVPFHDVVTRHGISHIVGAELHAMFEGNVIHVLAYGFDSDHSALRDVLPVPAGARRLIEAVHEAGGIVVLAHPLHTAWKGAELEEKIEQLVELGLDGLEAYYKPYSPDEQEYLVGLADRFEIITSAGSDFHGPNQPGTPSPGVAMPVQRWKQFREALGDHARNGIGGKGDKPDEKLVQDPHPGTINWSWLLLRIVVPSLLVIGFFVALLFGALIPTIENILVERKREMTTELTNSAWSILRDYHREAETGSLTEAAAQEAAKERVRRLRYGPDEKDYFWITDMHPRMVMHPYREDLEGSDLTEFTDPDGVRPFVAFVETVREESSGFVRYVWQWQDDPDRLEAKESYVRGFEPWGWIIGTGMYVDDVSAEIDRITRRLMDASFIVTIIAAALLLMVAYQSLKIERKRSDAEAEIRLSHERYRALVESSTSGTLLLVDGRCTYANASLLEVLGYSATELAFLDLHDIVLADDDQTHEYLDLIAEGNEIREPFDARLRKKDGQTVAILLSATSVFFSGRRAILLSVQDITRHRAKQSDVAREQLIAQLQTSLLFLTEPVRDSMTPPHSCTLDTPVDEAVRIMTREGVDGLTILSPSGDLVGIVTDHDVRERVVAAQLDVHRPVSRIMTSPVVTIYESSPVFEAMMLEREHGVGRLAVIDAGEKLVGMIKSARAVQPDRYSVVVLTQQIGRSRSIEELIECREKLPFLISSLLESGALARNICHVTTTVSDAITERLISLVVDEIGPPPCRFAFVALGSEARREQTLATDQDNALLYQDSTSDPDSAAEYFLELGERVCDGLAKVGYAYCKGENMAKNPLWNRPLAQWKRYFTEWIAEPDDKALAHCNVFFDRRCVFGDSSLVHELWNEVGASLAEHPAFFAYMARNTLQYKPPIGMFGRIVTGSAGEPRNAFNIKEAMLPIVNFARLYALQHELEDTNTFDRLERLDETGVLHGDNRHAIEQAYGRLMQLRFRHQVHLIESGRPADNSIDLGTLTQIDIGMLKHTFSQISVIQKKVTFEFHGTS
ncbi:MAG: CBS domain-containing protein [Spirochaetaceae bacterium]|nr:MAG: CBS domain-containing protein [Spirochaetaceae bacterium]